MSLSATLHTLILGATLLLALAGFALAAHQFRRWLTSRRATRDVEGWDYGDWPNGPGI